MTEEIFVEMFTFFSLIVILIIIWAYYYWFVYKCRLCGEKLRSEQEKYTLVCYNCNKEGKEKIEDKKNE